MLKFVKTCDACPEQYDVFHDEKIVGYVRVRWGNLYVQCPDVGGEVVYETMLDHNFGEFINEGERKFYLQQAAYGIADFHGLERSIQWKIEG